MKRLSVWLGAMCAVCLALADGAHAQGQVTPQDEAMNTLRAGVPREQDRSIVDDWIALQLSKLRDALGNPILIPGARKDFYASFNTQYNHEGNTPAFKQMFAQQVGAMFAKEYAKGQQLEPIVAHTMARQLLRMQDLDTREALYAGLTSTDQVVQYLSAQALVKLQAKIAADPQLTAQVLQKLGAAAKAAGNGMVAWEFYEAAAIPGREADVVPVILAIMDARLAMMRGGATTLDRGEIPALRYLAQAQKDGKLDQNLRTQVVQRLAPLLRIHTERLGMEGITQDERVAVEETINTTEDLLKQITRPDKAPDVAGKMADGSNAAINMQIELIQWIGGPDTAGILNKAPWNVPAGAP